MILLQFTGLALFCLLAAIPLTAFVLYPLCMRILAWALPPLEPPADPNPWPRVSLIISAFNEERVIREKLQNSLALDYPADRLQILVATDGSTDRTDAIVSEFADRGVVLVKSPVNRGKTVALERAVPAATHPILVFSDANSLYDPQALRLLVRWMSLESVGCVCGRLLYAQQHENYAETGETRYWSWDTRLKSWEGRAGYLLGANGAIFALRKSLAVPLPGEQANDMVHPIGARLSGLHGVFEPRALATETTADSLHGEFQRKIRIIPQGIYGVIYSFRFAFTDLEARLTPLGIRLLVLLQLLAKKLCRYLAFPAIGAMMLIGPLLEFPWPRAVAALLWIAFAMTGLATAAQPYVKDRLRRWPNFGYFLAVAAAGCIGVALFISRKDVSRWKSQR